MRMCAPWHVAHMLPQCASHGRNACRGHDACRPTGSQHQRNPRSQQTTAQNQHGTCMRGGQRGAGMRENLFKGPPPPPPLHLLHCQRRCHCHGRGLRALALDGEESDYSATAAANTGLLFGDKYWHQHEPGTTLSAHHPGLPQKQHPLECQSQSCCWSGARSSNLLGVAALAERRSL